MPFPPHIASLLEAYGIPPATRSALYDLYLSYGNAALMEFADLVERSGSPAGMQPEDTANIRSAVVKSYLLENHPHWVRGTPTRSLWHPPEAEGRASGMVVPLGRLGSSDTEFAVQIEEEAARLLGSDQPVPKGLLILGRNAHSGGGPGTVSFDLVADRVEDALEIGGAAGLQQTIPGSVGETSGTVDSERSVGLLREIRPNVDEPGATNQSLGRLVARHSEWRLITLLMGLRWLERTSPQIWIVRGEALGAARQIEDQPSVEGEAPELHDRTVRTVVDFLGWELAEPSGDDLARLVDAELMSTGLARHLDLEGPSSSLWVVRYESRGRAGDTVEP